MYGYNPEDITKNPSFYYYILLGKIRFFLQWLHLKVPNLVQFFYFVRDKGNMNRSISYSKGEKANFIIIIWKPFLSL